MGYSKFTNASSLTGEIHRPSLFIQCACSNCVSKACIYIVYVHVYLFMDDQCWLCFGKSYSYTCVRSIL